MCLTQQNQDVAPTSPLETFTSVVLKSITVSIFAYIISNTQQIMQELSAKKRAFQTQMENINRFMNNNQITEDVKIKVREYLIHLQKYANESDVQIEQEVISKLSQNLKDEIKRQVNEKIFTKFKFLQEYFTESTIRKLIYIIEEVSILPGQFLYNQSQASAEEQDCNLYLILKGEGTLSDFLSDLPRPPTAAHRRCT